MPAEQGQLPFSPIRNSELFSNHWLEHRLPLEPEWGEMRDAAATALDALTTLWRTQRDRVQQYGDEQGLEEAFIQPVLRELGWKLKYQTYLRGREPDYALFSDDASLDAALQSGRNSPEFWEYPALLADAKAWHLSLDRPIVVKNQREYPPEQIEWYLNSSLLNYAILTNGRLWRLIPRQLSRDQRRFQTYLECDLPAILDAWIAAHDRDEPEFGEQQHIVDDFLKFYLFFGPIGYAAVDDRPSLVERAVRGSSEYRVGVGEGLKERVFEALRLCIEGFLAHEANDLDPAEDLGVCREQSFILLYRLLFIMYAEDRQLLPYPANQLYTRNRSLNRHRRDLAARLDAIARGRESDYSADATDLWDDLRSLFDLVNSGNRRYSVPPYNGGLFDPRQHGYLTEKVLSDSYVARIIDQLSRAPDPDRPEAGLFHVDYRDLAIQHLGSIYEGLLELRPRYASERMLVVRKRERSRVVEKTIPAQSSVPDGFQPTTKVYEPGEVYLQTDKGERRASGSYYTPDHIVNYIVEKTLGPLCERIDIELRTELEDTEQSYKAARGGNREALGQKLQRLRTDFDDRVLELRVLDPAMGSGHFLLRACQYLAEEIATNPLTGDPAADQLADDESTLTFWKRRVVERCVHGVDINPVAVELAQLALWLETLAVGQPLSFLAHHLRQGNSLVGATVDALGALPEAGEIQWNVYLQQVEGQLPILLEPLDKIRAIPSETPQQVKIKERLLRELDRKRRRFIQVADLWCSTFFIEANRQPNTQQYQSIIENLSYPRRFANLTTEAWFARGLAVAHREDVRAFHWELEFPEVFFDKTGRKQSAGFNAVIGNPPYDVLSAKELRRDISDFKNFIEGQLIYDPSRRGKNNLYKLFICRSFDLLKDGGRLGQITPMAVLGDDQARSIRRLILDNGAFTSIDAFPQKDDPSRRVFPEAKLSTVVFTAVKTARSDQKARRFVSRVHGGRFFAEESSSLTLSSEEIPLYDPENLAIVSCDQADWDLATKVAERHQRLEEFITVNQGEVNETNERSRGHLVPKADGAVQVTRGSEVCLYAVRPPSQGEHVYLDKDMFLEGKHIDSKAYAFRSDRAVWQNLSAQNNFRRLIATYLPADHFCNHAISYCLHDDCVFDLRFLIALLNSKISDWYFRLASTNNNILQYLVYNLPSPRFRDRRSDSDREMLNTSIAARRRGELNRCFEILEPGMKEPPFSPAVRDFIIELVKRIMQIEKARGNIARAERSRLDSEAQPYQDLIDRLFYAMAGLTDEEASGLEDRLSRML